MKIKCAYDKCVKTSELRPHPKNPNKHPEEQIARLAQVIDYQGWRSPIVVSQLSGFITRGHGRLAAAKKNGWDEVPVNYQEYASEEQEYADLVADNAIAEWAALDLSSINSELPDLGPDFDIDLLGIKSFSLDPDFDPASEDEQGKLDEKKVEIVECPRCHEKYEKSEAKVGWLTGAV